MEWIKTDELEYIKQLNENDFLAVVALEYNDCCILQEVLVQLNDYTEEELSEFLDDFFPSLTQIKEQYGLEWKQKIVEVIALIKAIENAESNEGNNLCFFEEETLYSYLNEHYGIAI